MKIAGKPAEFGHMFMLRIMTSGTFTKTDTEVFHLETVIVYNFPAYFGHRVALTCFYDVRKEEVGSTKCSWETAWLWNTPDRSRNEPCPRLLSGGRRHQLGRNDERTQSSVQKPMTATCFWGCYGVGWIKWRLPAPQRWTFIGAALHALQPPSICIWSVKESSRKCSLHS